MKNKSINFLMICLVVLGFSSISVAQNSVGFNIGLSSYEGDLHCFEEPGQSIINSAGISFGAQFKKELSSNFNGRIAYQFARFTGDDKIFDVLTGHPQRGFDFKNNFHELTARLDLEPWKEKKFSPFISAGLGLGLNTPKTFFDFDNKSAEMQALIQEDQDNLRTLIMSVPLSIGANYRVSDLVTIGAELGWRLGVSDYLDGVSVTGSTAHNDYFGTAALTVNYALGQSSSNRGGWNTSRPSASKAPAVKKQPEAGSSGTETGDPDMAAKRAEMDRQKMQAEKIAKEKEEIAKLEAEKAALAEKLAAEKAAIEKLEAEKAALKTLDSDKDGIVDRLDACPNLYAKTPSGCPENTVTSDVNCLANFGSKVVNFQTSFADLSGEDKAKLNAVAEILLACPDKKVVVEGHTDARGNELVNQELSERRANQVKKYFVGKGIKANRILAVGYGETRPIASNDTVEGKAMNRRVEVSFY